MATGKAVRADDGSGLNIGTVTFTEDAVTKHAQQIVLVDATTPSQKAGVDSSGNVKVIAAANSGVDVGDVTINNASGASAVNIQDGGNSITVDGTFFQSTQPVSIADGSDTTLGAKADAKSTATDTTAVSAMSVLKQISASVQSPPSQAVTNAGTFAVQAAQSGTWNITNVSGTVSLPTGAATAAKQPALGTAGSASADVISIQGVASMTAVKVDGSGVTQPVSFGPATSGGLSISHTISAASTNATNVKASAGQVFGWNIFNNAAYPIYVKFHNASGTPTAGSGVVHAIGVQAGTGRDFSSDIGMAFSTGIAFTIVKDITDAGTTAVALSDCSLEIYWK